VDWRTPRAMMVHELRVNMDGAEAEAEAVRPLQTSL